MSEKETPVPVELKRIAANEIEIVWSDGQTMRYTASKLRAVCPCATCREKRRGEVEKEAKTKSSSAMPLPVLAASEAKPLTIDRLRPVGNYAYNIAFGDGHDSGLFTLDFLHQLGSS